MAGAGPSCAPPPDPANPRGVASLGRRRGRLEGVDTVSLIIKNDLIQKPFLSAKSCWTWGAGRTSTVICLQVTPHPCDPARGAQLLSRPLPPPWKTVLGLLFQEFFFFPVRICVCSRVFYFYFDLYSFFLLLLFLFASSLLSTPLPHSGPPASLSPLLPPPTPPPTPSPTPRHPSGINKPLIDRRRVGPLRTGGIRLGGGGG